ncbi:MAG TPA: hypothetical protein P5323_01295 [Candidatus Moranbacteria bacterium]|nr:hypothetical protein [Candidatus Moranbacteria bacterium]HSA08172.1 hypothetical protein [Candidatus Moranbacteria bacterium]
MKYLGEKFIILALFGMMLLSFMFLSAVESKNTNLDNSNVWTLYFADPKSDSLDFMIENHSKNSDFRYKILVDKKVVIESDLPVPLGETKNVPIPKETLDLSNRKITIIVTAGDNKKEIYKNF